MAIEPFLFSNEEIAKISNRVELEHLLFERMVHLTPVYDRIRYETDLELLQIELLKMQNWITQQGMRVAVLFEGRDAAGKGGAIRRFMRYLNPRAAKAVALGKPSDIEKGHWYFRRHVKELPNRGEMVFFDRSWYNRAVVEPVMGFCTPEEYERFLQQVPEFEHMLYEDGVKIIKFWFDISKEEQEKRFQARMTNPLKQWKISPVDLASREKWDDYTRHIREMFIKTHTEFSPWIIINTDSKMEARLESIRYLLSRFNYPGKEQAQTILSPDPNVAHRFYRSMYI